jgi:hypothetical protein
VNLLPFASESGAAFDGEKGGKWSQKLLLLVLCDARTSTVLYGKEIFLSRPDSIKSLRVYLRSTRIFCPRVFAFDGKYQLMRIENMQGFGDARNFAELLYLP